MSLIPAQQSTPFTDFGNTIFQTAYGDTLLTISPDATLTLQNTNTGNIMTFSSDNFDYNGTSVDYARLNALRAVCPSVNPTILGVNNTISLQNNDVIGSATHIINFSSGNPANVGEHFGIEYYSTTNDDFVLSSSTSGSLVYKQISGTTDELRLNPQQVYLYNNVTLTDEYLDITKSRIYMENKLGGGSNNTLISIDCEDGTGHPQETLTLYETSTIIRDDYIKIGNQSYNTSLNFGDLYCNNVWLNTINGMSPTTIGLTWANFTATNAWSNLPNNRYALNDSINNTMDLTQSTLVFADSANNKSSNYTFDRSSHTDQSTNDFTRTDTTELLVKSGNGQDEVHYRISGIDITQTTNDFNINNGVSSTNISILSNGGIFSTSNGNNSITSNGGAVNISVSGGNAISLISNSGNAIIGDVNNSLGKDCKVDVVPSQDTISLNAYNINTYGFAMPICFTRERNDSFNYSSGGQTMDNVYNFQIAVPYQFFTENITYTSTKWKIDFTLNCYNNSNVGDKGLALYFDFQDANSTFTFTPNTYNGNFPFAKYQQQSSYGGGSGSPYQNFNWTDWCDFGALQGQTSSVLPLNVRLYFAGDTSFNCNFYMAITLTRTNLV